MNFGWDDLLDKAPDSSGSVVHEAVPRPTGKSMLLLLLPPLAADDDAAGADELEAVDGVTDEVALAFEAEVVADDAGAEADADETSLPAADDAEASAEV